MLRMRLKLFLQLWVNDVRLLVQYGQYSHRRLLSLLAVVPLLWSLYRIGSGIFHEGILGGNPSVDHWCDREELPIYFTRADPEEITLVTAFFNLGSYRNGPGTWDYSDPYQHKQWMRPLGRVANPVIAYIEDDDVAEHFREIRSCLPAERTLIVKVRREDLWSFSLRSKIERIYNKPGYPLHYPNTVNADHTCASHAKYELLGRAVKENHFKTPFLAWLDITYFRQLDGTTFDLFKLVPPATHNEEMVSMSHAFPHDPNISPKDVIQHGLVWVSGEMLLGLAQPVANFTKLYREAVERLLFDELSSGDEQIVYLMYSRFLRQEKQVMVKTYMCHQGQLGLQGTSVRSLCLGYVCRNTWNKIHKPGYN